MRLDVSDEDAYETSAEILARLTGRPAAEFEYVGPIPDAAEQEWVPVDETDE